MFLVVRLSVAALLCVGPPLFVGAHFSKVTFVNVPGTLNIMCGLFVHLAFVLYLLLSKFDSTTLKLSVVIVFMNN